MPVGATPAYVGGDVLGSVDPFGLQAMAPQTPTYQGGVLHMPADRIQGYAPRHAPSPVAPSTPALHPAPQSHGASISAQVPLERLLRGMKIFGGFMAADAIDLGSKLAQPGAFGTTQSVARGVLSAVSPTAGGVIQVAAPPPKPRDFGPELGGFVANYVAPAVAGAAVPGPRAPSSAGAPPNLAAGSIRNVNSVNKNVPLVLQKNCVSCAIATDATLSGNPASAIGGGPFSAADVMAHYPGRSFTPANGYAGIETMMGHYGPGSRGIVWGTRGAAEGHVFNVVNQGGAIRFLDAQSGGSATLEAYDALYLLRTH